MSLLESESMAVPPAASVPAPAVTRPGRGHGRRVWDGRGLACACVAADALTLSAAAAVAALVHTAASAELLLLPPLACLLLAVRGNYAWGLGRSPADAAGLITAAIVNAALAAAVAAVALGGAPDLGSLLLATTLGVGGVLATRSLLALGRRRALRSTATGTPTLIVGCGGVGRRVAQRLLDDPTYGLTPVGFVDARGPAGDPELLDGAPPVPVLGGASDLRALVASTGARHVVVAFSPAYRDAALAPLLRDCERLGLAVSVVPRLFDAVNARVHHGRIGGLPVVGLHPASRDLLAQRVKRAFDLVVSACLLFVLSPLLGAVALAVRLDSPGPVLFRQRRVGRDGQVYDVLKFRSMREGPHHDSFVPQDGCAPGGVEGVDRRTRLGRFLRRSSLDELPQLLNVVRGEMSLVGPRPERPEYAEAFARDIDRYDERLRMRSGLTGWAQVHGLRGQTSIADRVEWDNYYIEHWSLGLDLRILWLTVAVLFKPGEG